MSEPLSSPGDLTECLSDAKRLWDFLSANRKQRHVEASFPGERVCLDCFYVGKHPLGDPDWIALDENGNFLVSDSFFEALMRIDRGSLAFQTLAQDPQVEGPMGVAVVPEPRPEFLELTVLTSLAGLAFRRGRVGGDDRRFRGPAHHG